MQAPACDRCGKPLRPDITLFDESLPVDAEWAAKKALRECDLFLAIGTSGTVAPAGNFVRGAKYAGAWTLLVNLTPMQPRHPDFDVEILGRAEQLLPVLLGA
jgi:NAD-dependent deacetylase